jgi:hypothetical protein
VPDGAAELRFSTTSAVSASRIAANAIQAPPRSDWISSGRKASLRMKRRRPLILRDFDHAPIDSTTSHTVTNNIALFLTNHRVCEVSHGPAALGVAGRGRAARAGWKVRPVAKR